MEAFHLSLREIRKRFTKSEMVMMAWRSTEMAANMENRFAQSKQQAQPVQPIVPSEYATDDADLKRIEERLGPIVYKMVDEQGEIDLRKLTGAEALRYMSALGIRVGGF